MISRSQKTPQEQQDARVVKAVRAFVTLQSDLWRAEQLDVLIPKVLRAIDEARAAGRAVDEAALIKQAWAEIVRPAPVEFLK